MLKEFTDWIKKPYASDMNAWHWFAFVGLILAIMMIWGLVIKRISE